MRIAQIAPIYEAVPPKKYGGTERVVYELTEELVRRGHDVTLFASGDSQTSAELVSVYPRALRADKLIDFYYGPDIWTLANIGEAYKRYKEFDLIHDHNINLSLPTASLCPTPVVMTLHLVFSSSAKALFERLNKPYFVSISYSQRKPVPDLNYIANVYHGLSMDHYPFSRDHDNYLLFIGRISEDKGVHHAIEVARFLNIPLIIAAKLNPKDKRYFEEYVEPQLSDQIRWVGEVDEEERNRLMSRAMCFLHPVMFREPFGLTLIEALACGCPIVAFKRGSIPEIISHGRTGFVVEDVEEMIEAVRHIDKIDREECRKQALHRFNAKRMTDEYEQIYEKVLKLHKSKKPLKPVNGHQIESTLPTFLQPPGLTQH